MCNGKVKNLYVNLHLYVNLSMNVLGFHMLVTPTGDYVYAHSTSQCQLFDVQHDELGVYMSLSDKVLDAC